MTPTRGAVAVVCIYPSPEFKGIKTLSQAASSSAGRIYPSPEFKGIKTRSIKRLRQRCRVFTQALNSKGLRPAAAAAAADTGVFTQALNSKGLRLQ